MTTTKTEYDEQAEAFLKATDTTFKAVFLKHGKHSEDDKENRDVYTFTFSRGERTFKGDFGQSITNSGRWTYYSTKKGRLVSNDFKQLQKLAGRALAKGECKLNDKQEEPSAYDVLSCLTKYDPGTFKEFCSEFGYDEDSKKVERIYLAIVNEWDNVRMLWTDKEIEMLQEVQ